MLTSSPRYHRSKLTNTIDSNRFLPFVRSRSRSLYPLNRYRTFTYWYRTQYDTMRCLYSSLFWLFIFLFRFTLSRLSYMCVSRSSTPPPPPPPTISQYHIDHTIFTSLTVRLAARHRRISCSGKHTMHTATQRCTTAATATACDM